MIYLDTSVALAQLLTEDRRPPASLWDQPLITSRLLEYELWNRIHARRLMVSHAEAARLLLARLAFLELERSILARALEPFPAPVRTLDALHIASAEFLRQAGQSVRVASYDTTFGDVARALGFDIVELP